RPRAASPPPPDWVDAFNYQRFCRIYLEQTYHIADSEEDKGNPFSDLYGELDLNLGRFLTVSADAEYDVYETRFSSHNVGASIGDTRGDRLSVEHRYTTSVNESIRGTVSVVLTDNLVLRGAYERNMLTEEDIVREIGFLYQAQCWSLDFLLADEEDDLSVSVLVNLKGIGGIGR
ncbi:LPS assembly protein LptD, partial [Desulfosarcina cetonica]|uniref:LPS assembly protein LptD n=1 Tax=Desulfosarcina cetonica TaxID=90730 RepID=UPI0012EE9F6D